MLNCGGRISEHAAAAHIDPDTFPVQAPRLAEFTVSVDAVFHFHFHLVRAIERATMKFAID